MGAYRYCPSCKNAQGPITVEEIFHTPSWGGVSKITCPHCGHPRDDDTPGERMNILAGAIIELKEAMGLDEASEQEIPF